MDQLLLNLAMALVWVVAAESYAITTVVLGYGLGAAVTWLTARAAGRRFYLACVWGALRLLGRLLLEQLKASLSVSWLVLNPRSRPQPGIV